MNKLKIVYKNRIVFYCIFAIIFAVILPELFSLLHISVAHRILWLFLLVDPVAAIWAGRNIKKQKSPWWLLFFLPVIFLGFALIRYASYVYWLAPVYLGLSYLAFAMTKIIKQPSSTKNTTI